MPKAKYRPRAKPTHPTQAQILGTKMLGLKTRRADVLVRQILAGFDFEHLVRLEKVSGLTRDRMAQFVAITPRTLARRKAAGKLNADESDRVLRASRIFEMAVDLFEGDVDEARRWLVTDSAALGGASPLAFASTDVGAREVENAIGRLEHGSLCDAAQMILSHGISPRPRPRIKPMIGMKLNQAKSQFFDRKAVTSAVDRGTRKVLSKFGAFVRTTAKTSIRKRKGSAPPGKPPHSHVGILRRLIFFAFEPVRRSVVIGPTLASRSTGEAPSLLEHGGSARIKDRRGKARRAAYKPRPYMGPAFQKEQQKLPAMWRDSVK